ncbi:Microtubules assembly and stabilization protein, partial [Teratosphaeriaceae sp. CCFEE 6253]
MQKILTPSSHEGGGFTLERHDQPRTSSSSAAVQPATPPDYDSFKASAIHEQYSALYHTGSAARWRRKPDEYFSTGTSQSATTSLSAVRQRSMEEVHGVDVSWMHRPGKQEHHRRQPPPATAEPTSSPAPAQTPARQVERKPLPAAPGTKTAISAAPARSALPPPPHHAVNGAPAVVTPPTISEPAKNNAMAAPSTPTPVANNSAAGAKSNPKRPTMLSRSSSQRTAGEEKTGGRRSSWLNNISSKFSSSQQPAPERAGPITAQPTKSQGSVNGSAPAAAPSALEAHTEEAEEAQPYALPTKSKESSFFSSLTRRLSSASTGSGPRGQMAQGGLCPRQVLNVDPNRERCLVPEMDPSRLRRVSFCVDVEIAGRPQYYSDEDEEDKGAKTTDIKMKERAEGAALKRPQAVEEEKEREGEQRLDAQSSKSLDIPRRKMGTGESEASMGASPVEGSLDDDRDSASRKKEKKQRSEAERKERKEKRRKRAEESGTVPVELQVPDDEDATAGSAPKAISGSALSRSTSNTNAMDTPPPMGSMPDTPPMSAEPKQDRPTTDPVRIYRRCCQLRETPILKRITEQLMSPNCTLPAEPGVVNCLDLTGSRLQLADVTTLGDWLAVVPVR